MKSLNTEPMTEAELQADIDRHVRENAGLIVFCDDCLKTLTHEEHYYYERRCEGCEGAWSDRMSAWMRGGEDPEMDKLYDAKDSVITELH